jgi:anti-anti-sigma factor
MEIQKEIISQGALLHLQGRFDTLAAQEFEQQMMATIEDGAAFLIFDCNKMDYISSSTLRVFLIGLKTMKRRNGKVILTNLQDHIKEVFDISGFLDLFEIFSSREDALAAI